MKRIYTIGNCWKFVNEFGQILNVEIGPHDFDPQNYEAHQQNAAQGFPTAPYKRIECAYVFRRKSDFEAAVQTLNAAGYSS